MNTIAFRLADAYLCCDCNSICDNANRCCACASAHGLLSLSAVMNRDPIAAEREAVMGTLAGLMYSELHETFEVKA